jgi:hypothetical protein
MIRFKRIFFTIVLALGINHCWGQKFVVSCEAQNVVYAGVDNPLSVLVEGETCRNILLKTTNGRFDRADASGSSCKFIYRPEKEETSLVEVFKVSKNKSTRIGIINIMVRKLPIPEGFVGGKNTGGISKKTLSTSGGIISGVNEPLVCASFYVSEYLIIVLRNKIVLATENNSGPRFSQKFHEMVNSLEVNDEVIFTGIKVKAPDGKEILLRDLNFKIVE